MGFLFDPFPFLALVPINLEATKRLRAFRLAGCKGEHKGGSRMRLIQKWRRVLVASLHTHDYIRRMCTQGEREGGGRLDDSLNICVNTHRNTLLLSNGDFAFIPCFFISSFYCFFHLVSSVFVLNVFPYIYFLWLFLTALSLLCYIIKYCFLDVHFARSRFFI